MAVARNAGAVRVTDALRNTVEAVKGLGRAVENAEDVAKALGISARVARLRLARCVHAGLLERFERGKYRVPVEGCTHERSEEAT